MKVILAIDHSPSAQQVIDSVLANPWPDNTRFKVVTAIEPLNLSREDLKEAELSNFAEKIKGGRQRAARQICEKACAAITAALPEVAVEWEIKEGAAPNAIINAAVDWRADRIVLGAHSRDMCPRYLLGSVSSAVVNHAPCSVEVVRKQKHYHRRRKTQAANLAHHVL